MKLILLGAPGAGKGTQGEILSRMFGIPAISTGAMLRLAAKNGTPMGLKAKEYFDSGKLVPDDVIIGIVKERLSEPDCKRGYILDGVPRTIPQALILEDEGIDAVIYLKIDDQEILSRTAGRRVCKECNTLYNIVSKPSKVDGICDSCGGRAEIRKDDAPETVKERLVIYHKETEPLVQFYENKGILKKVHNKGTIEETTNAVIEALGISKK